MTTGEIEMGLMQWGGILSCERCVKNMLSTLWRLPEGEKQRVSSRRPNGSDRMTFALSGPREANLSRRAVIVGAVAGGTTLTAPAFSKQRLRTSQYHDGSLGVGFQHVHSPLTVAGYGQLVTSDGGAQIAGTGRTGSLIIGAARGEATNWFQPLLRNVRRGDARIFPATIKGYVPGQIVMVVGGRSQNSSRGNLIPADKQFLTVVTVDEDDSSLQFSTPLQADLNRRDSFVTCPTAPLSIASTVQNFRLGAFDAPEVVYSHSIQLAYVVSLRDAIIDGEAATGFVAFSDHVVYDNVAFSGYSGISCARGTRRVTWRDCSYAARANDAEGYCAFLEESPEHAVVENFYARGGQFKVTNNSDNDVQKNILVRGLDLDFDGTVTRGGKSFAVPGIEVAFAASGASSVLFEGGIIRTPGGDAVDANHSIPRCAAHVFASRRVRFNGLRFANLAPDAHAIAVDGTNCFEIEITNCQIVDGSGKGLCHPSVLTNMRPDSGGSTMREMRQLEVGLAEGRVYLTWHPQSAEIICEWPTGHSRTIAKLSSFRHYHHLVIDVVAGSAKTFRLLRGEFEIVDGQVRHAQSKQAVPEGFPLRAVRGQHGELKLVLGFADRSPWRGTVRYLLPAVDDGRKFSLI
ncbi:hypothetical protein [Stakelama saccharophila]|uniref:Right handed beta helix domain-containing protein n=1 Tax=Stakelama saccharophila TaxID=3075605 RepID=A0ABZ0B995_9SPHN|nr:hypothetical protein [Stakelama sp. W311]WNO53792.1 hypothetical protein RPR59_00590 [Stakelama sp. W311]